MSKSAETTLRSSRLATSWKRWTRKSRPGDANARNVVKERQGKLWPETEFQTKSVTLPGHASCPLKPKHVVSAKASANFYGLPRRTCGPGNRQEELAAEEATERANGTEEPAPAAATQKAADVEPPPAPADRPSGEEDRSRKLLSSCTSLPSWLATMIPFPENVVLVHVVHKDSTLPHFQARLPGQETHNAKRLVLNMLYVFLKRSLCHTRILSFVLFFEAVLQRQLQPQA